MSESPLTAAARVDAVGVEGVEALPARPRPRVVTDAAEVEKGVAAGAANAVVLRGLAWAAAQREVNAAMQRGGRDPKAVQVTDAQSMQAIAEILIRVQETREDTPDAALKLAVERGEAVARALAGGTQE